MIILSQVDDIFVILVEIDHDRAKSKYYYKFLALILVLNYFPYLSDFATIFCSQN